MSKEQTKQYEGLRLVVYDDATGKPIIKGSMVTGNPTIGWGTNLIVSISVAAAEFLFEERYGEAESDVWGVFPPSKTAGLTDARRDALVDMRYQMGPGGFRKFSRMFKAILDNDWEAAGYECMDSDYGRKHPVRAGANATALRNG